MSFHSLRIGWSQSYGADGVSRERKEALADSMSSITPIRRFLTTEFERRPSCHHAADRSALNKGSYTRLGVSNEPQFSTSTLSKPLFVDATGPTRDYCETVLSALSSVKRISAVKLRRRLTLAAVLVVTLIGGAAPLANTSARSGEFADGARNGVAGTVTVRDDGAASHSAIAGGVLYVSSLDMVSALRPSSGSKIWSVKLNGVRPADQVRIRTLKAANGVVYVGWNDGLGSSDGGLYVLNAANGHMMWSYPRGWATSVELGNNVVYIVMSVAGEICALNARTGAVIWTHPDATSGLSATTLANGRLYVANAYNVYALNASTGKDVWGTATMKWATTITQANGVVYVGAGWAGNPGYRVYALSASTGANLWSSPVGKRVSFLSVMKSVLYVAAENYVYALKVSGGDMIWEWAAGWQVAPTQTPAITVSKGFVYVGGLYEYVYALSAGTGTLTWSYRTAASNPGFTSQPVVLRDGVYASCGDTIWAMKAQTGKKIWAYPTAESVRSAPTIVGGVVYFGGDDHKVYAVNASTGHGVWKHSTHSPVATSPAVAKGVVFVGEDQPGQQFYALKASTGAKIWSRSLSVQGTPRRRWQMGWCT